MKPEITDSGQVRRIVFILCDGSKFSGKLPDVLGRSGMDVRRIGQPDDLRGLRAPQSPACLLCMGGGDGAGALADAVIAGIGERHLPLPVVFLAERWDLRTAVRLMKSGASDVVSYADRGVDVASIIERAIHEALAGWARARAVADAKARMASLSDRERQIIGLALQGLLNKEIADELGLALVTIKIYRAKAMRKIGAGNATEMGHIAALAGLCSGHAGVTSHSG